MIKPWMFGALGGLIIGLAVDNFWQLFWCLLGATITAFGVLIGVINNDT